LTDEHSPGLDPPGPQSARSSAAHEPVGSGDRGGRSLAGEGSVAGSAINSASASDPGIVKVVMDDLAVRRSLTRIAHEILERHQDLSELYLVAIPNGGVPLGRILQKNLEAVSGVCPPLGILDTTLYRDDLSRRGERPLLRPTEMPSSVDNRVVLVVEDVVSTGRTIRAAMDAMMDFGRPKAIQVVALVDRGRRELPIKIDYVGKNIPTSASEKVRLIGGHVERVGESILESPTNPKEAFEVVVTETRDGSDLAEGNR
jgi:pyrimidine operon attenuation protein/uracil phosphoribosyltransferase